MGSALIAAASELQQKADGLNAMATKLRQPVAWFSPAATAFMTSAHAQASDITAIGSLMARLGQVLNVLAADLGSAKSDATAAVARSRKLDNAVSELNLRISIYHATMPLGSPPRAEADAAALADGQNLAASAVSGAEWCATAAWVRAGAQFDFISNDTSARRYAWAASGYDPNKQVSVGATQTLSCNLAAPGLAAGGRIRAPGGTEYPLVIVPTTNSSGASVTPSRDIPGNQGDWTVMGVLEGYTTYGFKASGLDKAEIIAGVAAGAPHSEGSAFDPARLKDITIMADGGAFLNHPGMMEGGSVKEATAAPQRTAQDELWVARRTGVASGRKAASPDGIGVINQIFDGVILAKHVNDGRAARYRVVFEEDAAGNQRARMLLYRVSNSPGEPETVNIEAAYVNEQGQLAGIPITGEDAHVKAYMH